MRVADFDYALPPDHVAQLPLADRDASRMMLLDRRARSWEDGWFRELPEWLRGDELVVVNNARVIPARLFGRRLGLRAEHPARVRKEFLQATIEVLLVRRLGPDRWEALVRPGRKVRTGERIVFGEGLEAEVIGRGSFGERELRFSCTGSLEAAIERVGHVPLPPYIARADQPADRERYQTIFARTGAAVAAPTAGLHFTPALVGRLRERGIELAELTLDVGLGTFQPIRSARVEDHPMHRENYCIPAETAAALARARRDRRPVLAVGTSVVRALEDSARRFAGHGGPASAGAVEAGAAEAKLFIYPGYEFRVVDQLLTNFHLPRSSLLVMVAAFAGRELVLAAYRHAVEAGYRFYSYGDCMLIR
ncbi:MAG TPA: tRNA preQ1(34) S-adenosylmethionine ribosyltransferase-isomerase QueA [Candidatus Acidoferrales bacterium]|nr:tRNA preQ1(34) S-adenosylmethionine ribosyltransferase-isomerase QueA [Candidatus Acidoferrales bacterium]